MQRHIRAKGLMAGLIFIFSILIFGCDGLNLDFIKPKKGEPVSTDQPTRQVKGTIIAKVNNIPITLEDLEAEIESFNSMVSDAQPEAKITTRQQKIDYLKNEVLRKIILYQAALDRNLDKKDNVIDVLEKTKQNFLAMELVREEAEKVDVSSKEIEDYYNLYKDNLKVPEERRIREIVVSTESEAKEIMIELLKGTDFATVARERSRAPTAKNAGDLGFIQRNIKSAQFDSVAFSDNLEVGKFSNYFKAVDGYYILKLEATKGGEQQSLSDIWDDIKRGLTFLKQQQVLNQLVSKLSSEAKIEIYEGEIK